MLTSVLLTGTGGIYMASSQNCGHWWVAVLVLLDLSAAFDTIDHAILLESLRTLLGIEGMAHAWFASYLTGRMQRVRIGEAWSLAKFLLFCVPQGSVLGTLLFLIYILPLHRLILSHRLSVHGYADDTQVYLSISDPTNSDSVRREWSWEVFGWYSLLDVGQYAQAQRREDRGAGSGYIKQVQVPRSGFTYRLIRVRWRYFCWAAKGWGGGGGYEGAVN